MKDFAHGDRVFIHHHVSCYSCYYCWHGDYTMCAMYQKSKIDPCGLSEEFLVPEWNLSRGGLIKLPDSVTFDEVSLIEPLACCIRAINKCNFQKGDEYRSIRSRSCRNDACDSCKSIGAGKIIFPIDINDFRVDFAKKYDNVQVLIL